MLFSCCSPHQAVTVSLLDQIADDTPAGSWRVLFHVQRPRAFMEKPKGLRIVGNNVIQTDTVSVIGQPVRGEEGERILMRVWYSKRWGVGGRLEARLLSNGEIIAARASELGRSFAEFAFSPLDRPIDRIEIVHHLDPDTHIPLGALVVLAIPSSTWAREARIARALFRWASSRQTSGLAAALNRRRFPLSRAGCTRDCVPLSAGDTLSFELPENHAECRLQFSATGLGIRENTEATVKVFARFDGNRVEIGSSVRPENHRRANMVWWRTAVDKPLEEHWESLEFTLSGADAVVALAEPVLLSKIGAITQKKNVILIDLDTMRADRLGCYGYRTRPTSTRMDSVLDAKGFFLFKRAYSSAPWTLPATSKFMTSRYIDIHHHKSIPRSYTTLAEILRGEGYYCVAFTGGGPLRMPGFEQGFHDYHWTREHGKVETTFPHAMKWLRGHSYEDAPFFLFLHTFEAHEPYIRDTFCKGLPHGRLGDLSKDERLLPKEFSSCTRLSSAESLYVEAAYDGGIREACDATADLFGIMDELQLWENTIVIVLSDHGEEFWEHFEVFGAHGHSLYGEQINVPFMLHDPDAQLKGIQNINIEVSTVDLLPTVADLLGIRLEIECDGISLKTAFTGRQLNRNIPLLATLALEGASKETEIARFCIISDGMKYIEPGRVMTAETARGMSKHSPCTYYAPDKELFRIAGDDGERCSLVDEEPQLTGEMAELLGKGLALALKPETMPIGAEEAAPLSPDLKRQLEALGYINN